MESISALQIVMDVKIRRYKMHYGKQNASWETIMVGKCRFANVGHETDGEGNVSHSTKLVLASL